VAIFKRTPFKPRDYDEPIARLLLGELAERLAESLRKLREEAGITQKDLSKRLGMSHATLNRLERGDHNVTLKAFRGAPRRSCVGGY